MEVNKLIKQYIFLEEECKKIKDFKESLNLIDEDFLQHMFYKFLELYKEKEPEEFYGLKEVASKYVEENILKMQKEIIRLIKEVS